MNKEETKLKVAAEEIKEILKKHDIAGIIALHTPGHGEFVTHLHTSYSCAYMYEDNILRFYSKQSDYQSKEEHIKKMLTTSNMMRVLSDITGMLYLQLDKLSKLLDDTVGVEHTKPRLSDTKQEENGSSI